MIDRRIVVPVCSVVCLLGLSLGYAQMHVGGSEPAKTGSQSAKPNLSAIHGSADHGPADRSSGNGDEAERGSALFGQNCAVCHGSDGRGGERAPDIATRPDIVRLSDAQLRGIISKGIVAGGMPSFEHLGDVKIKDLVAYLRVLQGVSVQADAPLPGDPAAGKAIFFSSGSCSTCHMVDGRGGFMGNELTTYAHGRSPAFIRGAIIHPDNSKISSHLMTVITNSGSVYRGLIRSQDNFTVVLQTEDGVFHSLARSRIRRIADSGHSIMPQDYGTRLSPKKMNDLVSYLMESARLSSKGQGTGESAREKTE